MVYIKWECRVPPPPLPHVTRDFPLLNLKVDFSAYSEYAQHHRLHVVARTSQFLPLRSANCDVIGYAAMAAWMSRFEFMRLLFVRQRKTDFMWKKTHSMAELRHASISVCRETISDGARPAYKMEVITSRLVCTSGIQLGVREDMLGVCKI